MRNFKKLFASVTAVLMLATAFPTTVLGSTYASELEDAYNYSYEKGVTTMESIDDANMYGSLTRIALAKMIAYWAQDVLGLTPDTSKDCEFADVSADLDADYDNGVTLACQMGLMGVNMTNFRPNDLVTRGEFGTTLSRAMWGDEYEGGTPYYADHLTALNETTPQIMKDISNPGMTEYRGYVMVMMQRADEGGVIEGAGCTAEELLACVTASDYDACIAACSETEEEEVIAKNGNLNVTMESAEGMDVPYGISSLEVATYTFEADEDVELSSLTLEQVGYSDAGTLDNVALFINGQRVSKTSNISTDDELSLDLTDTYTIKAGSSVEIAVRVTVGGTNATDSLGANGDKFAIKLVEVESSAEDVDYDANLTSDTFTVLSKANDSIALTAESALDAVALGSADAELFEFKLTNSTDQNAIFKAITFRASDSDFDEYFENFSLKVNGEVIAETTAMNGKYLTFNLEDGYTVEDADNEVFTVTADVIGGAAVSSIYFRVEEAMDLVVVGDKYDVPMTLSAGVTMASIDVSAGDITLSRTNPGSTSIIRNRTNLSLGSFTITNNAGGNLNLQDLHLTFTTGSSATGIANILKNVKVRLGSTSASLKSLEETTAAQTGWMIEDLGKDIGSKLVIYVYADIEDKDMTSAQFQMTLQTPVIEEAADDDVVSDITPSTLSFTTMKGSDSELKITNSVLATKSIAKGAEEVEATKFTVKTSTTEGAELTKMTFTAVDETASINSDVVTNATLYYGSQSVSATVRSGTIVVDNDITLAKNTTTTFTLKIDVASNATACSWHYDLTAVEANDTSDDENTLDTNPTTITGRTINIQSAASLSASYEGSAANNKYAKSILAGTTAVVGEYEIYSNYEETNIDTINVKFSENLETVVTDVKLYYNGELIASNPTWNSSTGSFENIDTDIAMEEGKLTVELVTKANSVDNDAFVEGVTITAISFEDAQGVSSGDPVTSKVLTVTSPKAFDIVPVIITTSVDNVTATTAEINLTVNRGSNVNTGNISAKATLASMVFAVEGSNGGLQSFLVKDSSNNTIGNYSSAGALVGDFTGSLLSAGTNTFKVYVTQSGSIDNPSYTLSINGVTYTTNIDSNQESLSDRSSTSKTIISK